jgi:ribosomal protein L11 methyltransferase
VEAARRDIVREFAALAALQPIRFTPDGLVCAPRAAPDLSGPALADCPLPVRKLDTVPGWPDPPSECVAGWYRRSPHHVEAPNGIRELVQVAGPAFGAAGHETTALCLEALDLLPVGAAVDAGCGSGMLALAWATLGRGPVLARDLDPDAVRQTQEAVNITGLSHLITVERGPIERLEIGDRVLLANIPPIAHRALFESLAAAPVAALLSGMRRGDAEDVLEGYERLGMRITSVASQGQWERWIVVRT